METNYNAPDISIIIPIYNTPTIYLIEALNSIETSIKLYRYEILLINDGSTDKELLTFLYNLRNPYIKIFHKENGGVSSARNVGLDNSKGNFILFLDSDDILLPEINSAIALLQRNKDFNLVYCNTKVFGTKNDFWLNGSFSTFKLIYINNMLAISTLFRQEIGRKYRFNVQLDYGEDWDFWCRIATDNHKFLYNKEPFFAHRRILDGKSLSQKVGLQDKDKIRRYIKNQFDPHKEITLSTVNQYVINNFRDKKSNIIKLSLLLFFPYLHQLLKKLKFLNNDFVID